MNLKFLALLLVCFVLKFEDSIQQPTPNQAEWILNKEHQNDFETNGSKVTFKYSPNEYNNFNAMYLGISAKEKNKIYRWEFKCAGGVANGNSYINNGISKVGIAKKENFGDNYGMKGEFFSYFLKTIVIQNMTKIVKY